jgi:pimeloyl-ACP methyl ester carboxylesterase
LRRLGLFLLIGLLAGCAAPGRDRFAKLPDGRHLHLVCEGSGSPVVLLESGFGATAGAWAKVQPELAKSVRVCAYDRAGYGQSDPGPEPRDGAAIAADLDQALKAEHIAGPFVVVGHSAGGLYVRLFADRHKAQVVGMVLVDPTVEHQDRAFAVFGPGSGSLDPIRVATERCLALSRGWGEAATASEKQRCFDEHGKVLPTSLFVTEMSELDTLWTPTSDEILRDNEAYGDMPIVVLTAGDTYKGAPAPLRARVEALWRYLHQTVACRSTRGEERLVPGSGHLIMIDRPDAVIQAVHDVIARGRGGKATPSSQSRSSCGGSSPGAPGA